MKTVIKIKLITDDAQKQLLLATMETFNAACDEIAITCFEQKSANKFEIQKSEQAIKLQMIFNCIYSFIMKNISEIHENTLKFHRKKPFFDPYVFSCFRMYFNVFQMYPGKIQGGSHSNKTKQN